MARVTFCTCPRAVKKAPSSPYSKVNYNAKGAHVKGLKNGKTYYAYVVYIQNNAVTQMSETATLTPAK